jgi:NAD(P)-dependent dehydrogenase (short-subunit alcohol dehydrogenase family)
VGEVFSGRSPSSPAEEHARACVETAIARYGRLDILVNNAGVLLVNAETDDMPVDRFDEHVRCNTRSAFLMTRYALPYLRTTRGNVICAGSESGISGQPRNTVYGATKAFLHAFYAFLASDEASFVTGALWLVDGGSTPAKGAVGALAGPEASTPPPGQLGLRHTHDGTRNKDMTKIA